MDIEIREFESVTIRRHNTYASTFAVLRSLKSQVQNLMASHASSAGNAHHASLLSEWKSCNASLSNEWKEDYVAVAKLSKVLDRKFRSELSQLTTATATASHHRQAALPSPSPGASCQSSPEHTTQSLPNQSVGMALAYHFYRNGQFQIGDVFLTECGLCFPEKIKQDFHHLYCIVERMRDDHQLDLALEWAEANRTALERRGSRLAFQLHKLNFLWLCRKGQAVEALYYAKKAFSAVLSTPEKTTSRPNGHLAEIQKLMGALLYVQRPTAHSPYRALFEPELPWLDTESAFIREYCHLLGLPAKSPLEVAMSSGCLALPRILKVNSLMKDKGLTWTTQNELPIEIDLDPSAQFHSVFSCPVLREPSSAKNPPMMLPCGHVISKEALSRLAKGSTSKFKCPYCPGEAIPSQASRVYI